MNEEEDANDEDVLNIYEATERSFSVDVPEDMQDSALEYELKLYNGASVRAVIYLVYSEPLGTAPGKSGLSTGGNAPIGMVGKTKTKAGAGGSGPAGGVTDAAGMTWLPVTRGRCAKGCSGPILSAIQRFGKQGRTQKGAAAKDGDSGAAANKPGSDGGDQWKDARNLFISIDEASNHVCAYGPNKCKIFRCVAPRSSRLLYVSSGRVVDPRPDRGARRAASQPLPRANRRLSRRLLTQRLVGF